MFHFSREPSFTGERARFSQHWSPDGWYLYIWEIWYVTRWRLSVAKGVAEWIYRGGVNGGKGAERVGSRKIVENDPFPPALQRYADVGGRKKTTEKLKWTPAGNFSARNERERKRERKKQRDGISMNEECRTAFMIINSILIIDLDGNFSQNTNTFREIFIIFASFKNARTREKK